MGEPTNDAHRWGAGWVRDFRNSGTYGSGVLMEGDGVGYAYIVGNPTGQYYWDAYKASGAVGVMGYPVGRHEFGGHLNDGPRANRYMTFQRGIINSFSGGTFGVHGAIRAKWDSTGHVTGGLGQPLSNEYATAARGGVSQRYEGGYITHNPAVPGEFVTPHGAVSDKYIALGSSRSPLGLPTSDQFRGERGNQVQRYDDGQITSHGGGTFETHGSIFKRWAASGGSNGPLGFPVSDEYATAGGGGVASRFERGVITFNPRTNLAYSSANAILDKYSAAGASQSYLVLPTSEEFDWEGGRRQNFDGGYVWWHPQFGAYADREKPNPASLRPATPGPAKRFGGFFAIGDSVSAGFGYAPSGRPLSATEVGRCAGLIKPKTSFPSCQAPTTVSYAAQYAKRLGLPRDLEHMAAVEGSTARDWWKGVWRQRLDRVVRARPSLTVMTLGANPALSSIVTPGQRGYRCFQAARSLAAASKCANAELDEAYVRTNLRQIYRRLLAVPGNHLAVFLYHDTVPVTLATGRLWPPSRIVTDAYQNGAKTFVVLEELNKRVREAFEEVRSGLSVRDKARFKLLSPPRFSEHYCNNSKPWILRTDTCIHPNAAGLGQFADVLQSTYPDPRLLAR